MTRIVSNTPASASHRAMTKAPTAVSRRSPLVRAFGRLVDKLLGEAASVSRRLYEMDFGSARFDHRPAPLPSVPASGLRRFITKKQQISGLC